MTEPILEMRGITKRFPGVLANSDVDLTLYPGEIHALLGENGAGKSTLMNVLMGIYYPNAGTIRFRGRPVSIDSTRQAVELGIGMVHQHFKLIETLTVAENLLLGAGQCPLWLQGRDMNEKIRRAAEEYHLPVDPAARIWQLSVGEQQRVEILKLLLGGAEVLILDEPTSVLTPQEAESLFQALRGFAQAGKSVLFITHKMNEVMNHADRITVLRGGRSVASLPRSQAERGSLAQLMVGRELGANPVLRQPCEAKEPALVLEHLDVPGDRGLLAVKDASFCIYPGEILGVAGVAGSGQRELTDALCGLRRVTAGTMKLNGTVLTNCSAKQALEQGIAYIPEDRMGVGLVSTMNMAENVILRASDKAPFSHRGLLRRSAIYQRTRELVERHEIKNAGLEKPVSLMSGGNLQKLLISRETSGSPRLIVASYPVHGLDVGATESIHNILLEQRNQGAAILLISEDLDELFEMSDRILTLFEGAVTGVVETATATYEQVGRLMLGAAEQEGEA